MLLPRHPYLVHRKGYGVDRWLFFVGTHKKRKSGLRPFKMDLINLARVNFKLIKLSLHLPYLVAYCIPVMVFFFSKITK